MTLRTVTLGLTLVLLGAGTAAAAPPSESFNERFEGRWTGTGTVLRSTDAKPRKVTCDVTGEGTPQRIAVGGTCTAAVVFTRAIGANLTGGEKGYSGNYIGSRAGTAQLSGRRSGDSVRLNVTFPKPVGPDRSATMIITNQGEGRFRLVVQDKLTEGGPVQTTTDLTFTRK